MSIRTKCILYLLTTAFLWSLGGLIIKKIDWNPMAIASSRSLVAALTVAFLARKHLTWSLPDKTQWLAAFFLAMVSISFVMATKLTTAANAIFLQYTAPLWVALLAPLVLRERTHGRDWFFMCFAFGGMLLFFMDSLSPNGMVGNLMGITCGIFFAALAITMRYIKNNQPAKGMICGDLIAFTVGLYFWRAPWPAWSDIALIVFAGVVQYGVSYYLFTLASSGASSLEMVLIPSIEPVLNPLWVFLVIGERPGNWAILGGIIVLSTVTTWSVLKTVRPSPRKDEGL